MSQQIKNILEKIIPYDQKWKIKLLQNWNTIIGHMKDKVIIEQIKNNTLLLGVSHPAWAQELHLLSPLLKKKINNFLKKNQIKEIRFRVKSPKTKNKTNLHEQRIKAVQNNSLQNNSPTIYALSNKEKKTLTSIKDKEFQTSIKTFLIRCKANKRRK